MTTRVLIVPATSAPTLEPIRYAMSLKEKTCKKRDSYDWNPCWNNSLKEIGDLLPISRTSSGRGLTKKETLIHMLQYFDFLQSHIQSLQSRLPAHCLPEVCERESESESEDALHSEPCTPPHLLKAKRKYSCTRSRKKTTLTPEPCDDRNHSLPKENPDRNVTANTKRVCPSAWSADDTYSNTQQNSPDSNNSLNALLPSTSSSGKGSSEDQEFPSQGLESSCSVCEDRTGSEDGNLGSKDLNTSPFGCFLLEDQMLGTVPSLGKKQLPVSPTFPQTSVLPLLPLRTEESLNLSPSLLTSPARGLSDPLLPSGHGELQSLFEDVWVSSKPTLLKSPSLPCKFQNESSEEDDKGSDAINWITKQRIPMRRARKARRRRFHKKSVDEMNSSLKKKCVNGFIMFCRMNRRLYLRTHPGTPSTVVTKELASLWHIMPKQERRLYCLKARHFSRQQNRNVRSEGQEAEREAENCIPSPLHMLLEHRDLYFASSGNP